MKKSWNFQKEDKSKNGNKFRGVWGADVLTSRTGYKEATMEMSFVFYGKDISVKRFKEYMEAIQ